MIQGRAPRSRGVSSEAKLPGSSQVVHTRGPLLTPYVHTAGQSRVRFDHSTSATKAPDADGSTKVAEHEFHAQADDNESLAPYQHLDFASLPRLALVLGDRDFGLEVVGTAKHQAELRLIAGARAENAAAYDCSALLAAEPQNYDNPGSVVVRIAGWIIGSLSNEIAPLFKEALVRDRYGAAMCAAKIVEAPDSAEEDRRKYIVRLTACLPFILHDVSELAVSRRVLGRVISTGAVQEKLTAPPVTDAAAGLAGRGSRLIVGPVAMVVITAAALGVGATALYQFQSQRPIKADVVFPSVNDAPDAPLPELRSD